MDDDGFSDKVVALYKQRQELGCPSTKCKFLQNTILEEGAINSYELCLGVSALLLLHDIELANDVLSDLVTLVARNMMQYNTKTVVAAFEICSACSVSKLMDGKDIQ